MAGGLLFRRLAGGLLRGARLTLLQFIQLGPETMPQGAFGPNLFEQSLRLLECLRAEIHPATMKQVSPMPCDFLFCEQDDHLLGQRTVDHSPLCQLCLSRDEKAAACPPCPATNTAPLTGDAAISREKAYFPTIACYAGPLPRKQWIHSLWFGIGGRVLRFRRPRALVRSSRQTALRPAPYCFSLIARLEQREFPPIPMPAVLRPYNPPCSGFVRGCVAK